MAGVLDKVTAFVVRPAADGADGYDVLLFRHHAGGIQVPAGTVEPGEEPDLAVLREAREETGLLDLTVERKLGSADQLLAPANAVILDTTPVYARPMRQSFDWATLRRGLWVTCQRRQAGFVHVTYREWEDLEKRTEVAYQITGWVPETTLADVQRQHFYLVRLSGPSPERWTVHDGGQDFSLFWAPRSALPDLGSYQNQWLTRLPAAL